MASILTTQSPAGAPTGDNTVCLGLTFYLDSPVSISKLRYWKRNSTWDGQSISMGIWNPANTLMASASRTQQVSDPVGWIEISLGTVLDLTLLTDSNLYTVALKTGGTNLGNYAFTLFGFSGTYNNVPFHVPIGGGRFTYSASLTRPLTGTDTNYFADIVTAAPGSTDEISIADIARANMLLELGLVDPQPYSNVDLMELILADSSQTLITSTDQSAAAQYMAYLLTLE